MKFCVINFEKLKEIKNRTYCLQKFCIIFKGKKGVDNVLKVH